MASELILYDLPSKDPCTCWSLNPWKTRMVLNYKGIPYKTEWTEYPDVSPKLSSLGIPRIEEGRADHTIPAVTMPDGTHIMDSANIVVALEKLKPMPSVHHTDGLVERMQDAVNKQNGGLGGQWISWPPSILPARSYEYFHRTRSQSFGMPISEFVVSDKVKAASARTKPALEAMKAILEENPGPFVLGEEPSYADFIAVSWFHFLKRIGANSAYEEVMGFDESFGKLYEACKPWLERDDH